ncbi:MAG: hypothetical protein NTU44_12690 [Bacteroidetes bacterium]|nr:hypothetical protein [Bacteroidota bacterium]
MKTLKKVAITMVLLSALLMISVTTVVGQKGPKKKLRDKIEAQQITFLTHELQLTPAEAKTFWPVYEEFRGKREVILKDQRKKFGDLKEDEDSLSEKQLKELADSQIILEQRLLDLKKEYHARFMSILPPRKVIRLYEAEKDFRREMLKKLRDRRGDRGDRGERGDRGGDRGEGGVNPPKPPPPPR